MKEEPLPKLLLEGAETTSEYETRVNIQRGKQHDVKAGVDRDKTGYLKRHDRRRRLGQAGRQRVEEHFHITAAVKGLQRYYYETILGVAREKKDAGKFDFGSKVLQRRINFSKTKKEDIQSVKDEYSAKKDSVISQYKEDERWMDG